MRRTISRRSLLSTGAGVLVATAAHARLWFSAATEEAPAMLDHILLGCSDLAQGIDFVAEHTGVRAAFGGSHPGRGTRNALLALGERHYLEIIAPDPQQSAVPDDDRFLKLTHPRLVGWAAHPGDLNAFAIRLRKAGLAFDGPNPGSRHRPDGRLLRWKTLQLKEDQSGLLPFFIEWSADTVHPSADAPSGCKIVRFSLSTPHVDELAGTCSQLDLAVPVEQGETPLLRARISGPQGKVMEVTS